MGGSAVVKGCGQLPRLCLKHLLKRLLGWPGGQGFMEVRASCTSSKVFKHLSTTSVWALDGCGRGNLASKHLYSCGRYAHNLSLQTFYLLPGSNHWLFCVTQHSLICSPLRWEEALFFRTKKKKKVNWTKDVEKKKISRIICRGKKFWEQKFPDLCGHMSFIC